jgi:Patatin-like phospholipase
LNSGELCSFTFGNGFGQISFIAAEEGEKIKTISADSFPLAKAVAASSAFPPLFPPVALSKSDFPHLTEKEFIAIGPDYLTDGGVFDNLGANPIRQLVDTGVYPGFGSIILSDATAVFDYLGSTKYFWLFTRTSRTTDILMYRLATLENELWRSYSRSACLAFKIGEIVQSIDLAPRESGGKAGVEPVRRLSAQPKAVQGLCRRVRTDLDQFDADVMLALMRHGYEVAASTIVGHNQMLMSRISAHPWELVSIEGTQITERMNRRQLGTAVKEIKKALEQANRGGCESGIGRIRSGRS